MRKQLNIVTICLRLGPSGREVEAEVVVQVVLVVLLLPKREAVREHDRALDRALGGRSDCAGLPCNQAGYSRSALRGVAVHTFIITDSSPRIAGATLLQVPEIGVQSHSALSD